jgi:hypothetical protein
MTGTGGEHDPSELEETFDLPLPLPSPEQTRDDKEFVAASTRRVVNELARREIHLTRGDRLRISRMIWHAVRLAESGEYYGDLESEVDELASSLVEASYEDPRFLPVEHPAYRGDVVFSLPSPPLRVSFAGVCPLWPFC